MPVLISTPHPATRRRSDVVTTSLCTSQWRRRYVSNETPNDVTVERRQDVSVVPLHDVLLVCRVDVPWERNDDVPSVRLHDVSVVRIHHVPLVRLYDVFCNSQIKHPITSLWYVSTTSWSHAVARPCLQYSLYYVLYFKLLWHDLHLVGFQVSLKHQIKHLIFQVLTRWEKEE